MARPPANAPKPPQLAALESWPPCPDEFDSGERAAWKRLGVAAMAAGTLTEGDLLLAEECARNMARLRVLSGDKDLKATTLKGWSDLVTKQLCELGLSPKARKNIAPPKEPEKRNKFADLLGK